LKPWRWRDRSAQQKALLDVPAVNGDHVGIRRRRDARFLANGLRGQHEQAEGAAIRRSIGINGGNSAAVTQLEAIRRDQVDQIRRAVQPPHHERHRHRGDDQSAGAPQSRGAPTLDVMPAAAPRRGRASRSSTIGQCSRAETRPSAIEIHHIMS
jgi:hypothetical protein